MVLGKGFTSIAYISHVIRYNTYIYISCWIGTIPIARKGRFHEEHDDICCDLPSTFLLDEFIF